MNVLNSIALPRGWTSAAPQPEVLTSHPSGTGEILHQETNFHKQIFAKLSSECVFTLCET